MGYKNGVKRKAGAGKPFNKGFDPRRNLSPTMQRISVSDLQRLVQEAGKDTLYSILQMNTAQLEEATKNIEELTLIQQIMVKFVKGVQKDNNIADRKLLLEILGIQPIRGTQVQINNTNTQVNQGTETNTQSVLLLSDRQLEEQARQVLNGEYKHVEKDKQES